MRSRNLAYIFLCTSMLAGCASQTASTIGHSIKLPEYFSALLNTQAPTTPPIESVKNAPKPIAWWESFSDPVLSQLIKTTHNNNHDIKIAELRIHEARAARSGAISTLMPQLSGVSNARSENRGAQSQDRTSSLFDAAFDASWEIDIWGGNRERVKAADSSIRARQATREGVILSLIAETARNYIELRNVQNQIAITENTIRSQRDTLALTQSRRSAGIASELDVSQAQSLVLLTESRLPPLDTMRVAALNRLAVLSGEAPGSLNERLDIPAPVPVAQKEIVLGLPSEIIAQRPDIREAEQELLAATALTKASITDLYPKLTLSGLFGGQDSNLLSAGSIWSVGAGISAPIFNFGRIQSQIDANDARKVQAFHAYQQRVLLGLEEIENALTAYINEEKRRKTLADTVSSSKETAQLASERYTRGITAFVDVLTAQRALYDTQSQLAESEASVSKNLVALYKSLGAISQ